ncbi:MAG: glycerol-3-phosphate responsive antiterminator [Kiritimatiellae bacterium]|nr:glycerol-3-phosphate responsive antiterminator [Kiritimatiellia bacterium]
MRVSIHSCLSKPVIPVVWDLSENSLDLSSANAVFLQGGEVSDLPQILAQFDAEPLRHLAIFVHLELLDGLESNEAGVHWLAGFPRCAGIITVRHRLVPAVRKHEMLSIIRLFLHDGRSVERGVSMMNQAKPDAVEVLPAIAATVAGGSLEALRVPLIAGGLIKDMQVLQAALKSGCRAVSTSKQQLWQLNDL